MHRHLHAQERRNRYPESRLWETEAGHVWLRLLVWAVLYLFGLECGVGGDKLSRFFKRIRIDTHVGVSPSRRRHAYGFAASAVAPALARSEGYRLLGCYLTQELLLSGLGRLLRWRDLAMRDSVGSRL